MVSRESGLAAAKICRAEAYLECSQDSVADLDKLFGCLLGYATAQRLETVDLSGVGVGVAM